MTKAKPNYAANKMVEINVRILSVMGYLNRKDPRLFFILFPGINLTIWYSWFLVDDYRNVMNNMIDIYLWALHVNVLVRIYQIIRYVKKFEGFLERFIQLYDGIMKCGNPSFCGMTQQMTTRADLFSKVNLALGFGAVCINLLYPVFIDHRKHPYSLKIFDVDFLESPYYELVYCVEIFLTMVDYLSYICFGNLMNALLLFGLNMIWILKDNFRRIAEPLDEEGRPDNAMVRRRLARCVQIHRRILTYVAELNELLSMAYLVEILVFGSLLCILLFLVQVSQVRMQMYLGVTYIGMVIFQIFSTYWLANQLIEESSDLALALYDCPWYTFDLANQKTVLIIMGRLQKPMEITLGNVAPITLQTFQSILNMSYSYFTIIRRSIQGR